jgi:hypothetical protein
MARSAAQGGQRAAGGDLLWIDAQFEQCDPAACECTFKRRSEFRRLRNHVAVRAEGRCKRCKSGLTSVVAMVRPGKLRS